MMVVRVDVSPNVLEWARVRSRIDADEFETRFPKFRSWLIGETKPTVKQLETFAKGTHTPFGYLFLEEPPVEELPIPDFRTVADGPVGRPSADLLDIVYVCQARQDWYRNHQLLGGEQGLEFVGSMTVETPATHAAEESRKAFGWTRATRSHLGTWDQALTELRERAESLGVLVMISGVVGSNTRRKLDPSEFRGFALADELAPVVFVNGVDSKAAQVFTLAHELAHLWLGETGLDDLDPRSERAHARERWCSQVAAQLLVPMDEFREVFDADGDLRGQLGPLAERFRVSTQVILGRVREAGRLSWEGYVNEMRAEQRRVAEIAVERGTGGNFYYTKPVQVGKRFAQELIASTLEGATSYTEAFRLLNVKKMSTFEGLAERLGVT